MLEEGPQKSQRKSAIQVANVMPYSVKAAMISHQYE